MNVPESSLADIKIQLYQHCIEFVDARIRAATDAIHAAQASANDETKSSAGDKYETGRAMAQLEIEKNSAQLADAQNLKRQLASIRPSDNAGRVQAGSLVITNQGFFYIAIAGGQATVQGENYVVISPASPLAQKMQGLHTGDSFTLNQRKFEIRQVA